MLSLMIILYYVMIKVVHRERSVAWPHEIDIYSVGRRYVIFLCDVVVDKNYLLYFFKLSRLITCERSMAGLTVSARWKASSNVFV